MFDWKIAATGIIVLCIMAFFIGSSPSVSGFFAGVSNKVGNLGQMAGINWGEKGTNEITLYLDNFSQLDFQSTSSFFSAKGNIEAQIDSGTIGLAELSAPDFTGSGVLSPGKLEASGSVSEISSSATRLKTSHIVLSSSLDEMSLINSYVAGIIWSDASGEAVMGTASSKFSGNINMKNFRGSIDYEKGKLILSGTADSVVIPSAGINVGR